MTTRERSRAPSQARKRAPKKPVRRRANSRPPSTPSLGAPVSFRQTAYSTVLTQGSSDVFGGLNFILSQATNYTGFTDLWDIYRVDYLEFSFEPLYTANSFSLYATNISPRIYTVIDKDDVVAPASINTLKEYQSCRSYMYEAFKIKFRPGTLTGIFDGTSIVAGRSELAPWIDCSKISIPHFGVKYGIEANSAGSPTTYQRWNVSLVVGLTFKNVR